MLCCANVGKGRVFVSRAADCLSSDFKFKEARKRTHELDAADYAEALKECGKNRALHQGRHLHSLLLLRYGPLLPTFLSNCLVQMYGLCASPHDAQKSFDAIPVPTHISWTILIRALGLNAELQQAHKAFHSMRNHDVVSWNAMIGVYAQNGHCEDAINLFVRMQLHGPAPSNVTFVCVLDACSDLQTGCAIHDLIIKFQYEGDITVGNALITMYGKLNNARDAERTFLGMKVRNVVTWSALIAQYVYNGEETGALRLFCLMLLDDVKPNNITCISVLDACSTLGELADGQKIYAIVVDCGYEKSVPVGNALVNMYGKCGSLQDAKSVFNRVSGRNLVTWSSLMGAHAQKSSYKEVLQLLHLMQCDGIQPDKVTFLCVLDACVGLTALEPGQITHAFLVENGHEHVVMLGNALINFYGKCQSILDAKSVFINLSSKNVVSWSTMIAVYAQNGHGKEALDLFYQMQAMTIKANDITLVSALEACTVTIDGHLLHTFMVCNELDQSSTVQTALVNLYDKLGSYHDAKHTFEYIIQRDVISWTSGIAACAHSEHGREALNLFYQMQVDGVGPNSVTFICVLDACSGLAALEEGQELHSAIINSGCDDDGVVINALINMYGKCGNAKDAVGLFVTNPTWDLIAWNAVLSACALNGQSQTALHLFNQMKVQEIQPNEVTFICILTSCSHAGFIEDGLQHFISLTKWHGLLPTEEHFACVIDLKGRAGQLEVAEHMFKFIPFKQAMSALASLLGACKIHGDADRGLCCAMQLLDVDPQNAASYVVLSNMYASASCE